MDRNNGGAAGERLWAAVGSHACTLPPPVVQPFGLCAWISVFLAAAAGCSREAALVERSSSNAAPPAQSLSVVPPEFQRVNVSLTNELVITAALFRRTTPPPWDDGNSVSFRPRLPDVDGKQECRAEWSLANMHSENLFEITRRLGLSEVQVDLLPTKRAPSKVQEVGRPDREVLIDYAYAVVTDPRIPKAWFLAKSGRGREGVRADAASARVLKAAFPDAFR